MQDGRAITSKAEIVRRTNTARGRKQFFEFWIRRNKKRSLKHVAFPLANTEITNQNATVSCNDSPTRIYQQIQGGVASNPSTGAGSQRLHVDATEGLFFLLYHMTSPADRVGMEKPPSHFIIHPSFHSYIHSYIHSSVHSCIHTYIHMHPYIHIFTHT